jgi:hypothetical protein
MSWVRSIGARAFIAGLALAGLVVFAFAFAHWQTNDPVRFVAYLIAALLASSLKVGLPGIEGTLSVNFIFTQLGILELSLPETLLIGLAGTLGQFYWRPARQLKPVQLMFNVSQVTVSSAAAYGAYQLVVTRVLLAPGSLALVVAAITHFACNTTALSTIIGLTEDKSIRKSVGREPLVAPSLLHGWRSRVWCTSLNGHIGWQFVAGTAADLSDTGRIACIWANSNPRKFTLSRSHNFTCARLKLWHSPSKPKTKRPANICSGYVSMRWNWPTNWV